jgi:hypothetical protein
MFCRLTLCWELPEDCNRPVCRVSAIGCVGWSLTDVLPDRSDGNNRNSVEWDYCHLIRTIGNCVTIPLGLFQLINP